jgi:putative ABC transport system permease protein
MLKNFITVALRNLRRQVMYSFLNLFGLAIGMACSLVIFLYVFGEWSHDRHFANADRIYRIGVSFFNMGPFANGPERLMDFLPKEFQGIESYTRFQRNRDEALRVEGLSYKEEVYYVDSSFFNVFSYSFIEGAAATAMLKPHSIVLSERMAKKYFKDLPAMGRTIEVGKEKDPYVVTGIVKDDHRKTHLKASAWMSLPPEETEAKYWTSASFYMYVLLRKGVSRDDLNRALDRVIEKNVYPESNINNVPLERYVQDENSVKFSTLALTDIYLRSKASLELSPGGNETNLYIFSVIAVFILVLAGVNFINLSTARATRRAKEVGIRKSLGTSRGRLIVQFLLESVLMSLFSMVVALGLAELFSFAFFWITGQQLAIDLWSNFLSIIGVLLFALMVGLMAGIYPAFYLTSFQPVNVLKGNLRLSGSQTFRNTLVVFQFSISIALIISTTIIIRQLNFMSAKDLGFAPENVITIDDLDLLKGSAISFKDELLQHPDVINGSLHAGEPGSKAMISVYRYQTSEMENSITINTYFGDHEYIDVMGLKLLEGRNFNKDLASDTSSVILNESAVRVLNLRKPIGAVVSQNMKVIGVVSDFHWESLRNEIAPLAIIPQQGSSTNVRYFQLALQVRSSAVSSLLKTAEKRWKELVPDEPFKYHFLDENFGALLKKEEVLGKAIGFFTVLAILISCLGLFGLAAYTTEQRTKEIGIRKVLGASVTNIVMMLNKQFTLLVLISMLIAIPVSYYAAEQWLAGFAYRTDLSVWLFLGGGITGLMISYCTVAFQSIKASRTNPAETLKCE